MIKEASYSLFDIFGPSAGIIVRNIHLNPGDEVADRPTSINDLFKGGIYLPPPHFAAFKLCQKVFGACPPGALDGDV